MQQVTASKELVAPETSELLIFSGNLRY